MQAVSHRPWMLGLSMLAGAAGVLALLWLWGASPASVTATPGVLYVAPGGNCGGATPCYASPQAAVDAAVGGDEIRVAGGTYAGINNQGSMAQVVYINKSVSLRGGYAAPFTNPPDPLANPTTLDAESQGRVMSIMGPAEVDLAGLRLTNGKATNMGGLYLGQYTCNNSAGRGAGGGVCIQAATVTLTEMWIVTNTASTTGGYGGGLFAAGAAVTLTNSTVQGNNAGTGFNHAYGGGLALLNSWATVADNTIVNNNASPNYEGDGGGLYLNSAVATVQGNLIQGNQARGNTGNLSRLGGGGVAVEGAGAEITGNQVVGNVSNNYVGGGLAWKGGLITVSGNLVLSNTASWGGGMWAGNAPASVDSNVIAGNIAGTHGSALYVNSYSPNTPLFRHNTIARNSGGDNTAVYAEDYGRMDLVNTIFAGNVIGIGGGWSTSISLDRTLWDGNITDTIVLVSEVGHLAGPAAFAADGYHLTEASAAVDAGIAAGVTSDIDGEPRPRGSAPDVGADESPYSHGAGGEGISVEKTALPPRLMVASHSSEGAPVYLLEQEYLILLSNGLTNTAMTSYGVEDTLPAQLDFAGQVHYPPMTFQNIGNSAEWQSQAPLPAETLAWMSVVGNASAADGGQVITNVADVAYTLSTGESFTASAQASSTLPNFPPFIAWPENGEFCLNRSGELEISGLARPGATVYIYGDGLYQTQATASISGTFSASYEPPQWGTNSPVVLTAKDCSGGPCGDTSNAVTVRAPYGGWDPQRSVWEGTLGENLLRWPFRNEDGDMATQDWEIPGAFGFNNTTLNLYECSVPDPGYDIVDIVVDADGSLYQDPDGPDAGGWWGFSIGYAHSVNFMVSAECECAPGATKTYTSHGQILIDPDGFVFDVTKGLVVISSTVDGLPIEVGNTVPGVTVTAMISMPLWGGWVPWPAHLYNNQVNPQVTGDDGYFAFFTPPGTYMLQVEGIPGYQAWRSPVVQVITEIVHVNVPYTPWPAAPAAQVTLTPQGLSQESVAVQAGESVEWVSTLDAAATLDELRRYRENPLLHLLSDLNPLSNTLGWDSGMMAPGYVYRRVFKTPGTYGYSDGAGHSGQVVVEGHLYLPALLKQ